MTPSITVAAPPTTAAAASQILAAMAALSGVLTDYNPGSQVRTNAEAVGSVIEQQGIWAQTEAYQALVYSALSLFQITSTAATPGSGAVTFNASSPVTQNIPIPAGTLVQTNGGTQFATTTAAILASGSTTVSVNVQAVIAGSAGNVPAGAIIQVVSALIYPLTVTNATPTGGGANQQSSASALAQFAAQVSAIGLSSPVAIANAGEGVTFGSEVVMFTANVEPWILAGSGAGSGTAGWILVIDNGTGTASPGLINAVISKLNGGSVSGVATASGAFGYRVAGVPYSVVSGVPTLAVVDVTGTVVSGTAQALVQSAMATAVSGYFTLPFGTAADQGQLAANVANAVAGQLVPGTFALSLYLSGSGSPTNILSPPVSGRVVLGAASIYLSGGM